jgi:hypothetical protein
MITVCQECDHLHPDTAKQPSYRWMCMKHPRLPLLNPLTGNEGNAGNHYMRCEGINGGACPLFQKRKEPTQ